MTSIPDGYGIIAGRNRATAQAAIAAAIAADVDPREVVSTGEGYIVPLAVLEAYTAAAGGTSVGDDTEDAAAVPASPVADAPTEEWKNADIKEWALAHDVDLGDATKKADMLAAIAAAGSA